MVRLNIMNTDAWHTGIPDESWTVNQQKLGAHFLQERMWGEFQHARGQRTFYAQGEGWSWLAILEQGKLNKRLYCPYGPTAVSHAALHAALVALMACAHSCGAAFIRVEPRGQNPAESGLRGLGLRRAKRTVQPRFTFIKDLTRPQDELIAEMSATNRNLHRNAANKGLTFRGSSNPRDITILVNMLAEVAEHNRIRTHGPSYFTAMANTLMPPGAAKLFVAEHEGKPVAAALTFESATTRYYAHAGSKFAARKLHAGTPLVSHMIIDARAAGKQQFDFYGIAPPNEPNHPWNGFTAFKQSFGGQAIDHGGTWEMPIKKLSYALYRAAGKLVS